VRGWHATGTPPCASTNSPHRHPPPLGGLSHQQWWVFYSVPMKLRNLQPRVSTAPMRVAQAPVSWRSNTLSSTKRCYTYAWQVASKAFLAKHPFCECDDCIKSGYKRLIADVVDHKVPHRGDMRLFWQHSNWQAMHHTCHNRKTAKEDGGFGNV
jgi:5-methylcytosine-specific restriction enzyme A